MKRYFLSLVLLLLLSTNLAQAQQPLTAILNTFEHDDLERSYYLYVPDGNPTRLLLMLHPFGSNGRAMEVLTRFDALADEYGFIVAYPNSEKYYWDDGRTSRDVNLPPDDGAVDDIGFLAALSSHLSIEYDIESSEVYLTGFKEGGRMAYTAACHTPENYDGVAVVGALMWFYQAVQCPETSTAATNMLMFYGTNDHIYEPEQHDEPISGRYRRIYGQNQTLEFWAERNGCDMTTTDATASYQLFTACADATTTAMVTVQGMGNNWSRIGDYQLNRFGIDTSTVITRFFTGDDWQTAATQPEPYAALPRTYNFFVPESYNPENPTPLVVLLHGRTANPNHQAYVSDMNTIAEREGFITLYPEGIDTEWNYVQGIPAFETLAPRNDDVFLATLIDDIALDLNIDSQRVYVTGLSNGGFMTQRLACTQQDRYAAFASVGATMPFGLPMFCEDQVPVPIMYVHGTADNYVPWDGISSQNSDGVTYWQSYPMGQTMGFWSEHNGCELDFEVEELPQSDVTLLTRIFTINECPETAPVIIYAVIGGGHVWVGANTDDGDLGRVSRDFSASEVIWEFFQQHTLDE